MAALDPILVAFNRGIVSKLGLARVDVKRITLAAEQQENWMPRVLGSMMLRPGLGYTGATLSNAAARQIPFVFSTSDTARLEFTDSNLRIWINDTLLSRVSVSTAVTNGTFNGNINNWTDNSGSGCSTAYYTSGGVNYAKFVGTGTAQAILYQLVTVASADQGKEHALRIVVGRGPITLQIGSSAGASDIIAPTTLDTGTHSIAFTPTVSVYVQFSSYALYQVLLQSCTVESAGTVALPSPFLAADLGNIRYDQSADVVFLACAGYQQRKIERRGTHPGGRSWSIVLYKPNDGPFFSQNATGTTVTPSATTGDITVSSSAQLFYTGHVGALWSITTPSAQASVVLTAQNQFSSSIKVTGITGTGAVSGRSVTINISGTWSATVTIQQSVGVDGNYSDYQSYTTNQTNITFADGLDNQTVYYRIGIKTGNYTSGTANASLTFPNGSQTGIVRITGYTNSTSVSAQVLTQLGGTSATSVWAEGQWSTYRGFPSALKLFEGRMWQAGQNGIWGSVSDAYASFDETVEGDSGPLNRTVGAGPLDTFNWILGLQRLILGAQGAEIAARSSSFDTPLTPTDFALRNASTQGSSPVDPVTIDTHGVFVQRGGYRLFELAFDLQTYEYQSTHLTALCPDIGSPGIVRMAVQRQPDTRIHAVRSDGTAVVVVYDKVENVLCLITVTSGGASGVIEDVCVLPAPSGSQDDQVYYVVKRTINGATVRYIEKWAQEADCKGAAGVCKLGDAYVTVTNSPSSTTVTGLSHLEGQQVVVWADGADVGTTVSGSTYSLTYTVSGGQITLASPASSIMVGLPYQAKYKSAKLAEALPPGAATSVGRRKRITSIGPVLADTHPQGLQYGPDFSTLDNMPMVEDGVAVSSSIWSEYDKDPIPFQPNYDNDARLCLVGNAPRPVTVCAAVVHLEMDGGQE